MTIYNMTDEDIQNLLNEAADQRLRLGRIAKGIHDYQHYATAGYQKVAIDNIKDDLKVGVPLKIFGGIMKDSYLPSSSLTDEYIQNLINTTYDQKARLEEIERFFEMFCEEKRNTKSRIWCIEQIKEKIPEMPKPVSELPRKITL